MHRVIVLFIIALISTNAHSQLGAKANKLIGVWNFKHSDGFEVWSMQNDDLIGNAYRVNKMGDTSRVEKLSIRKVQKNLAYSTITYNLVGDTIRTEKHFFLGGKRKLRFENVENNTPQVIIYKFGFFNRNKLKIFIQLNSGTKAKPLILYRQ